MLALKGSPLHLVQQVVAAAAGEDPTNHMALSFLRQIVVGMEDAPDRREEAGIRNLRIGRSISGSDG